MHISYNLFIVSTHRMFFFNINNIIFLLLIHFRIKINNLQKTFCSWLQLFDLQFQMITFLTSDVTKIYHLNIDWDRICNAFHIHSLFVCLSNSIVVQLFLQTSFHSKWVHICLITFFLVPSYNITIEIPFPCNTLFKT